MSDNVQFKSARLAVLIDAENAMPDLIEPLLKEVAKHGIASIKRIYGDWTKPQLSGWISKVNQFALRQVQQCSNGKNSADITLAIDAMDLLHTQKLDVFCIVSSDSDYVPLALRIREQGLQVFGFGEAKTKQAFVSACDRFIFIESLKSSNNVVVIDFKAEAQLKDESASQNSSSKLPETAKSTSKNFSGLTKMFKTAYQAAVGENEWVNLGIFGHNLKKLSPSFNSKNYGHSQLRSLVQAIGIFEVEITTKGTQIKLKQAKQKA